MEFDIDVSGEDIFKNNYTICIASKDGIIKGFKITSSLINILNSNYRQGRYRYQKSKKGRTTFKVRLYCIIIYYLFKSSKIKGEISLNVCRDFNGKENDIRENLKYFLIEDLRLNLDDRIHFAKLDKESNAHKYAFLMREDRKNKMTTYVNLKLSDIEKWLEK